MTAKPERVPDPLTDDFKRSIEWHLDHGHRLIRLRRADGSGGDPKAPADPGWRKSQGLSKRQAFRAVRDGHNLGWAPSGDYIIIDVDMHGKDGLATFDRFKSLLPPLSKIPKVASSRGGFHLYFRKPDERPISRKKLVKQYGGGVDIIVNQQVVIPASIHPVTKLPYEFVNMPDEIPDAPETLMQLLTYETPTHDVSKRDDGDIDPDHVASLLSVIPNDDDTDYDTWFETACSIHKSTGGSEDGRQLFHHWSALNPIYDYDYTEAKWNSIGNYAGPMRGFGSLLADAKRYDPQIASNVLSQANYVAPEDDFRDLPPPDRNFDAGSYDWRLVEEPLDYSDIEPDEWFYKDVLPRGAYAVMAGRQGLGKSTLLMKLAACVTTGETFPGDDDNPIKRDPGDVAYFSVEERVKQSVLPKLKLAKADLKRFHIFRAGMQRERKPGVVETRGFSVTDGIRQLEEVIRRYPQTKLIIFDPITMFIVHNADSDTHNTATMNQALAPLNHLAEKYGVCILGITHFNKSGGRGLDKVTGSIAHTTVARHVTYLLPHFIAQHTVLATAKSNMFTDKRSYVFEGVEIDPEYVDGFATPLRQRDLHLHERCDEARDADQWEELVAARLEAQSRQTAVEYLIDCITQYVTEHSLQTAYWTSRAFKTQFRQQFNSHERTFDDAIHAMLDQNILHQENVGGTWFIWYIDGLIASDPEELERFNEGVRQQIRSSADVAAPEALKQEIIEYVRSAELEEVPYEDLYDHFLEHTQRQIQNATRSAVREKTLTRVHKARKYYISCV